MVPHNARYTLHAAVVGCLALDPFDRQAWELRLREELGVTASLPWRRQTITAISTSGPLDFSGGHWQRLCWGPATTSGLWRRA